MVVLPLLLSHLALELLVIVLPVAQIEYKVRIGMLLFKEGHNIINVIAVDLLEAGGGEGHATNSPCYISDIKIVLLKLYSLSFP